jgi:hypothetical protein
MHVDDVNEAVRTVEIDERFVLRGRPAFRALLECTHSWGNTGRRKVMGYKKIRRSEQCMKGLVDVTSTASVSGCGGWKEEVPGYIKGRRTPDGK